MTYVEVDEHAVVTVLGQLFQFLHLFLSQQLDVHLCEHRTFTLISFSSTAVLARKIHSEFA